MSHKIAHLSLDFVRAASMCGAESTLPMAGALNAASMIHGLGKN
jgi:hypothetical protein